jgi:hypothetical protein
MPCGDIIEALGIRMLHKVVELDEMVANDAWIRCEASEIGLYERLLDQPNKFRFEIKKGNPDSRLSPILTTDLFLCSSRWESRAGENARLQRASLHLQQTAARGAIHSAAEGNDHTGRLH